MKKNKMMRMASALLVATLLSTSVIAGTFAKYTTSASGTDTAKVAKFGVVVTANGTTFAKEYDKNSANQTQAITKSVVSTNKVVAPGTNGNLANSTISGTPEVAVHVGYDATLTLTGWKAKGTDVTSESEYCPIVFTVNGETYGLTGIKDANGTKVTHESNNISDLQSAVKSAIENYSADYAANTDLSKINENSTNGYVSVSWEWAFDKNDDVKDTYLADQQAKGTDSQVDLTIATTVTQID